MLVISPLSRRAAFVAVALALSVAPFAHAQREFVEEIEPEEKKKGTLDSFDLDAPDPVRDGKKPADPKGDKKPADPKGDKKPVDARPDAGPEPSGAASDRPPTDAAADAGPGNLADGGPAPADTGVGTGSFAITVTETSRDAFFEKWETRAAAARKGEAARAKKLLPDLEAALLDFGVQGLPGGVQAPAAASALIVEARRALDEGSLESAQALIDVAHRAAPDLVAVHTATALIAWRAGDVGKTIDALIAAARCHARDPLALSAVGLRALVVLGAVLLAVLLGFALLAGLRALRYLAFDVGRLLPKGAHPGQVLALIAIIAVAPFFLGAGPVLSAVFLLALTWLYLERNERVLVTLVGVLCVGLPFMLQTGARLAAYPGSRAAKAHRALTSIDAEEERRAIEAREPAARDVLEQGALALHQKRLGRVDDARAAFDAIVAQKGDDPSIAWVHGEVGVLAAIKDDADTALKELGKAIASDPRLSAARFNSSILHFRASDTRRAEEAVQTLAHDEPDLLGAYRRTTYRAPDQAVAHNRAFVDVLPPAATWRAAMLESSPTAVEVEGAMSRALLRGQTGQRALGLLAAFPLLCVIGFALRNKLQPARACSRCGDPASPRMNGPNIPEDTCGQCFHAFVSTRSRIDAGVKLRKERAIARRAKRVGRTVLALSLVCPGAGHLYCAAAVRGAVFLSLWVAGLGGLALALDMWPMPRLSGPWSQTPALVALGVYLLVVWALALKSSFEATADAVGTRRR